jgi:TolB-like protein
MSSDGAEAGQRPPTVFLSYASEDRQAARSIGDALPAYGLEVWYDESELGGGDAWDQKIRRQIRECDYFMALVSAHTEARHEGYFRREWRLAVERTHDMADDHLFLLPVVIDDTKEAGARVPDKFLAVQWLRVPGGQPTAALEALCRRLVSGDAVGAPAVKPSPARLVRVPASVPALSYPEFPRHEPGQRLKFWVEVVGWAFRCAWTLFRRLPRWIRIILILWLAVVLLSRSCTPRHHESSELTPAAAQKLKSLADQHQGGANPADYAKLGAQIAREFSDSAEQSSTARSALLVIPFAAPAADATAKKLADSTLAQVYGRLALSHSGQVGLSKEAQPSCDLTAAVEQGRSRHSSYVLCGAIDPLASPQLLTITIATIEDGTVLWSKSYPVAGADPAKIAAEVDAKVPPLEDD